MSKDEAEELQELMDETGLDVDGSPRTLAKMIK